MTKTELIAKLDEEVQSLLKTLSQKDNPTFFQKQGGKWSIAENTQHLVLSAKPLNLAFTLPKFIFRILFGKPNRKSHPYEEIVKRYDRLLKDGAVATGAFVPKSIPLKGDKSELIDRFRKTYETLLNKIGSWSEEELDNYFLPHPLLGKLTVREMLCFTAHHINHHHNTIKRIS